MSVNVQALSAALAVTVSQAVKDAMESTRATTETTDNHDQQVDVANVEAVIDTHIQEIQNTATGSTGTSPSQKTQQPSSRFESIAVPLSSRVPSKTKAKIWANEYVDFGALLATNHQQEKFALALSASTSAFDQPKLTLEPAQPTKKITGINQWLTAFHTYCAIYSVKFPSATPSLMKYCEIVRDLAAKPGDWLFYDEQFRYLRQSEPDLYPWDGIHWELWLKAATSFRAPKLPHPAFEKTGARGRSQQSFPRGTCWFFQGGKPCKGCKYPHVCHKCGDKHPGIQCASTQQGTPSSRVSSPFTPTGNTGKGKAT
jgi:hypothetical protein